MEKVFNLSQINELLKKDRKVVFTHGSFDLFHIGHLFLLKESSALGGKLAVGLDSDQMLTFIKRKPVFSLDHRLHLISQLDFVDYIIPLECDASERVDEYYWKLYHFLKPDLVTYGMDFQFHERVNEKCRAIGAEYHQVRHQYSNIHTRGFISTIAQEFGTGTLSTHYLKAMLKQYRKEREESS